MKLIAVMGDICAGKDSLKDYLVKKGWHAVKLGNILRGEALRQGVKISRDSLYEFAHKLKKDNPYLLVERALAEAKKRRWKKLVIGDVRNEYEVLYLKKMFKSKVKFIRVKADLEVRFSRIKLRSRAGDPKTLEEFKKVDAKEAKRFGFKKLFNHADYTIENNNGYEHLHRDADKLLKRINL